MARPALRMRIIPRFPARIQGTDGIAVDRTGGVATVRQDWSAIADAVDPADLDDMDILVRDNTNEEFVKIQASDFVAPIIATQPEAEAGVSNTKVMTPLRTSQWFAAQNGYVTDAKVATPATAADGIASSKLRFQQPDADSVPQTVQAVMEERLSVTNFWLAIDADWSNAFQRAHDAAVARGGDTVAINKGDYAMAVFPPTSSYVTWQGKGIGTRLIHTATTGNFVTLTGLNSFIRMVRITASVRKTSGFLLVLDQGIGHGARDCYLEYGYDGLLVTKASQATIENVQIANLLGPSGIFTTGTAVTNTTGMQFSNITVAGALVPSAAVNRGGWAASTAYSLNDVVTNAGALYICTTAGTSASSGGPSGLPLSGTTPQTAFSNTITDGTVAWKFLNHQTNLFTMDSYSYSLRMMNVALLWGFQGFVMSNSVGLGASSMPKWVHSAHNLECDTNWSNALVLAGGGGFHSTNSWYGTSKTGIGVYIAPTYSGDVSIINSRINNNWNAGVLLEAGPTAILLEGNFIGANSIVGAGTSAGFVAANNATSFTLRGNRIGPLPSLGGSGNQKGVILGNGCDGFVIESNDLRGNNAAMTVGTLPGTSGKSYVIKNNLGYTTEASFVANPTSDAAGTIVMAHGLSVTPTVATGSAFCGAGASPVILSVVSLDATNVTMRAFVGTSPLASSGVIAYVRASGPGA